MTSHSLDLCRRDASSISFSDKASSGQVVNEKILPQKSCLEDKRNRVVEGICYPRGLFARHLLRLHLSSEELFLTLHTPEGKLLQELSLKDRNLEVLSPKEAAQRIKTLGLHNLTFVLHKSPCNTQERETIQAYLLPKLQGAMDPSTSAKEEGKSKERGFSFYRERSASLQDTDEQAYHEKNLIGLIRGKLSNFLADPFHLGVKEFTRAVESLENECKRLEVTKNQEEISQFFQQIPWEGFLHSCSLCKKLLLEKGGWEELYTYCEKLTDLFIKSCSIGYGEELDSLNTLRGLEYEDLQREQVDRSQEFLIEEEFLKIFKEIRLFFQGKGEYLQEQRYLTLSLIITNLPSINKKLFLEGGERALAFAEEKRVEELAFSQAEDEEYKMPMSFQKYEDASIYFAAAYNLITKHKYLEGDSLSVFERLYEVQGRYLSVYLPKKNEDCETYAYGYKRRSSEIKRSSILIKEKQALIQEMENAADYLEACGYFKLAYCIYDELYGEFQDTPGFQADKYLAITTELGKESSAIKAKERFLKKIEQYRNLIQKIREDSLALIDKGMVLLEEQKEISERYRLLIKELFHLCSLILDPKGQYVYALMAVGSLARHEMCPFSDFEVALILEQEKDRAHFRKVGELFHLLVLSLGETKLAIIGKEKMLPQGFSLDKYNNPLRLCGTTDVLSSRQTAFGEDPVQLNVLRSGSFLTGEKRLFEDYYSKLTNALDTYCEQDPSISWRKQRALGVVKASLKYLDPEVLSNPGVLNIKENLLRLCVFAFENLCLYYNIPTSCHTLEKLQALVERDLFPKALQEPFEDYLNFAFALRWKAHLQEKEEQDIYTLNAQEKENVILAYRTLLEPFKNMLNLWCAVEESFNDNVKCDSQSSLGVFVADKSFSHESSLSSIAALDRENIRRQILQDPTFFARAYFDQAMENLTRGSFKQALFFAEKAALFKSQPQYFKLCGSLYFSVGKFKKAEEFWRENISLFTEKLLSLSSISSQNESSSLLAPAETEKKTNIARGEWNKQKKLHIELLRLAEEQETIRRVLKEAFIQLEIIGCWREPLPGLCSEVLEGILKESFEGISPERFSSLEQITEEVVWKKTLDEVEKILLGISYSQQEVSSLFIPLWRKSFSIWLQILQHKEEFFVFFKNTYTDLPKVYRREMRNQIISLYPDRLSLLQDLYSEEGYAFSAQAKKNTWLRNLHRTIAKDSAVNRSESLVAGLYLPRGYFYKEIEEKLFQDSKEFKKSVSWGNHFVNKIQGHFFKKNPESPGDEYAVFLLNHLITGQGSPPVEVLGVVNQQSHLLLASQEIQGEPLHIFLSKYPEALSRIDKKQFSQMFLMALLTAPEDGKADNYIAFYTQNIQGEIVNVQLIGVDNDHVFVKPFISKEGLLKDEQLFIKTILFCFEEMKEPLHPEVAAYYLKLDVAAVLEEWLQDLVEYNQRIERLFSKESLNKYWEEGILLPFFMHLDQVLYLYEKMTRLKQALKPSEKKVKTQLDLLKFINPKVGEIYETSFAQCANPYNRFERVTKDAYRRTKGNFITLTRTSQIKENTFKRSLRSLEDFKQRGFTPEESLKVLMRMMDYNRFKELTEMPLEYLQQDIKKALTTPLQEELLENQNWAKLSSSSLPHVLEKFDKLPLRKVNLSYCKGLTDTHLIRFIQGCRHPITEEIEVQILNLQGCTTLTSKFVDGIEKCFQLKKLYLEGINVDKINLSRQLRSLKLIDLKNCRNLTFLQIEGPLKRLIIQGCTQLRKLSLYCPNLRALLMQGVPSTVKYRASKDTPLSEILFPLLKKAQEEEVFNLEVPLNDAAMELFERSFHDNTSLKSLVIQMNKNYNFPFKMSKKLELCACTNLESLQINAPFLEFLQLKEMDSLKILEIRNGSAITNLQELITDLSFLKLIKRIDLRGCPAIQGEQVELLIQCQVLEKLFLPSSVLEYRDSSNQTPVHFAVKAGNEKLVMHFFAQGMAVDTADDEKNTPLQLAIKNESQDLIAVLERLIKLEKIVFSRRDWLEYFGDVGEQPPLPDNIWEILTSPCPIWPEKKVEETHLLTLIPQAVNNKPLTLDYLQELVESLKERGGAVKYRYYDGDVQRACGEKLAGPSHWVLLTKDVLDNTRKKSYKDQCQELERLKTQSVTFKEGRYRMPIVLEAATSILMEHVRSGNRLYSDKSIDASAPHNYLRCEETSTQKWRVVIGGFGPSGLVIDAYYYVSYSGLALLREFSEIDGGVNES